MTNIDKTKQLYSGLKFKLLWNAHFAAAIFYKCTNVEQHHVVVHAQVEHAGEDEDVSGGEDESVFVSAIDDRHRPLPAADFFQVGVWAKDPACHTDHSPTPNRIKLFKTAFPSLCNKLERSTLINIYSLVPIWQTKVLHRGRLPSNFLRID